MPIPLHGTETRPVVPTGLTPVTPPVNRVHGPFFQRGYFQFRDEFGANYPVFSFSPVASLSTDTTLSESLLGRHLSADSATDITLTIPLDTTILPTGYESFISRDSTGKVSFATESGAVTLSGDITDLILGELAFLKKIGPNSWRIWRFGSFAAFAQEQTLPGSGGIQVWDFQQGATASVSLTADTSFTLANIPSTPEGTISFTQDGTGGHVVTLTNANFNKVPCLVPNTTSIYKVLTVGGTSTFILQNPPNILTPTFSDVAYSNQSGDLLDITYMITLPAGSDPVYRYDGTLIRTDTGATVSTASTTPNAITSGGAAGAITFTAVDTIDGVAPLTLEFNYTEVC